MEILKRLAKVAHNEGATELVTTALVWGAVAIVFAGVGTAVLVAFHLAKQLVMSVVGTAP